MGRRRSNYALVEISQHLGAVDELDLPWSEFVGDRTPEHEFEVPTADAVDAYVTIQAYDVGVYDHEVLINGETVSGFDIPPADGWQCWMDVLTGPDLVRGTNTVAVARDGDTDDSFALGTVRITWREPVATPTDRPDPAEEPSSTET